MRTEGYREKQEELDRMRRRYRDAVQELQDMARRMTILARLLAESPEKISMSSDRASVQFPDKRGGERLYISRSQIDQLPDQIGSTLLASRDIYLLEKSLTAAGFGDRISP